MAFLYDSLALLLGTALTFTLVPYLFRMAGRLIGAQIKSKTQQRRELLLTRAAGEEQEQQSKSASAGKQPPSSTSSVDEEWEKVTEGEKTPTETNAQVDTTLPPSSYDGVIGFFHPFCNAGGGGERLLFAAVLATQKRYPSALCVVYTGDHDASKGQILTNVRNRFNIELNAARVCFLYLSTRDHVLASSWPHFTLLGQSLGSLILAWDAFTLLVPDIYIDTMGYAFTLALCKWLFPSMPTGAYVHYPTISTDMLSSLNSTVTMQGLNAGLGKGLKGKLKQYYWQLFARLYSWVGGSVDVVMTNSTWTHNHIAALWGPSRAARKKPDAIAVVYPPCAVEELQAKIPVNAEREKKRTRNILYIAQFRPEKMHTLILDAFHTFLKSYPASSSGTDSSSQPNLVLIGSVRDDSDEKRVYKLRLQAEETKNRVQFIVNAKWPQILEHLRAASVGVNGMWNEHFGIGVVEYQAAGLIAVVNDSGGPKADIVVDVDGERTGFHASTEEQFAAGFAQALALSSEDALAMRLRARKNALRFSEDVFQRAWTGHLERLVELTDTASNAAKR